MPCARPTPEGYLPNGPPTRLVSVLLLAASLLTVAVILAADEALAGDPVRPGGVVERTDCGGVTPASGEAAPRPDLRKESELVCPRSRVELFSRSPIHRQTERRGVLVPFLGNRACPMSGDPVLPTAFFEHEGERVYFCCPECAEDGSRRPEMWLDRAYAAPAGILTPDPALDPEHGQVVRFQSWEVQVSAEGRNELQREPHLTLVRALYPDSRLDDRTCPVTGGPGRPDIVAISSGKILLFSSWEALESYLDETPR